jgi:hypothetical protein
MSGKEALKLKDLQRGQVVSLQLATDPATGLVIIGIRVVDKPVQKTPEKSAPAARDR